MTSKRKVTLIPVSADFSAWYQAEAVSMVHTIALAFDNADIAQDVTAEAFARAWVDWERVQAMDSPSGWVYRVAVNLMRTRLRRARLEQRFAEQKTEWLTAPPPVDPDDELWEAVAALAPRARLAVSLRYVTDLSEVEIAEAMGVTRGTVASTLSSARRQLAEVLTFHEERMLHDR